jgi:uncharacterized repeat protein (TIGR03803 family)
MPRQIRNSAPLFALAVTLLLASSSAQTFTTLHSFNGTDGDTPQAALIRDAVGNLYGTTMFGGAFQQGVIFKLDKSGTETVLRSFMGHFDGGNPRASLMRDASGNLYGTTSAGGTLTCNSGRGCGVAFKLNTSGIEIGLHSFTGSSDGRSPVAGLIGDADHNLYGTTFYAGENWGVVFKLDSAGHETVLHSFTGNADGAYPYSGVIRDAAGNLYGTTFNGGDLSCQSPLGCGVVYKVDAAGTQTVLHQFSGTLDGSLPIAGVISDAAGNLYGTTSNGGASNLGVVFKLDAAGTETILHSFAGSEGANPDASLVQDATGNLYGTTFNGGASGMGVVFKLDSAGTITVLHEFTGVNDGGHPSTSLLIDGKGNLYGTTTVGGAFKHGAVFRIAN